MCFDAFFCHCHWIQCHDDATVLGVCVEREELHVLALRCREGGKHFDEWYDWMSVLGMTNRTPSAVGSCTHSLAWLSCFWAFFLKVMSLCHLCTLLVFSWSVVHRVLRIKGKVAWSFGLNWCTTPGCNGSWTCWHFHHPVLLSLSFARRFGGMLGIQTGDTSMLAGVWGCCVMKMFGVGGISSGTLYWLKMTWTSRYSRSEQYLKWKEMCWYKNWAGPDPHKRAPEDQTRAGWILLVKL